MYFGFLNVQSTCNDFFNQKPFAFANFTFFKQTYKKSDIRR